MDGDGQLSAAGELGDLEPDGFLVTQA